MDIVSQLIQSNYLKTPRIIDAFRKIKRRDFVPPEIEGIAESNEPFPIGCGQTISQPLTVAFMLELLQPKQGEKVLDIGSGSGWTSALLAEIVGPKGKVFAIERIPELKEFGEKNARKYDFVDSGRIQFITGDGSKGLPDFAPFNCIHVAAAASRIPLALSDQLAIGGRMVIPLGVRTQNVTLVRKIAQDVFQRREFPGFAFVPLIEEEKKK